MRHRTIPFIALAAVLAGACVETPAATLLAPDDVPSASIAEAPPPQPVRVLSRNLYLGADIDQVLGGGPAGAAAAWAEVQHTSYPERAAALAAEIAARRPHLVGLQEVTRYTVTHLPSGAVVAEIDFLDILQEHIAPLGYRVVTRATNFQAPIPLGDLLIRYADGDAILALESVDVHEAGGRHFAPESQVDLGVFLPGLGLNLRGFQWADVSVTGQRLRFVNTHLETQRWAEFQEAQAAELLGFVASWEGPVVMAGDFNSAANPAAPEASKTATYAMIRDAGFDDLWLRGHGAFASDGLTCCQSSDLSNDGSLLSQRIDFLFARNTPGEGGYAGGARLEVVGEEPADRFTSLGGYTLWPSDHAGLFGELWLPPGLSAPSN